MSRAVTVRPPRRPLRTRRPRLKRTRPGIAAAEPAVARESPVTVEALAARWRAALDAADEGLRAAAPSLAGRELGAHVGRVTAERRSALVLLRALAHDRGVSPRFLHLAPRRDLKRLLGLPEPVTGCVFNLDGVLIGSARLHADAWAQTLDEFMSSRMNPGGGWIAPFDLANDYERHFHGRLRLDGVHSFLASRGLGLSEGSTADPPGTETVYGLANRKNELLRRRLATLGVHAYEGSQHYLEMALEAGVHTAVVSASANAGTMLDQAGLAALIEGRVDGNTIVAEHLRGRPAPDRLLAACRRIGVDSSCAAAFETSPEGIRAARAGGFAFIVGVDEAGRADALRAEGAHLVVPGLGELLERNLSS